MSAKRRHSDQVRARVRTLLSQGVSVRQICERLHVSETAVKRERAVLKSQRKRTDDNAEPKH